MYNIGIDVGGTFTDVLMTNSVDGSLLIEKVLSTPEDQSLGVLEGMERICEKAGINFSEVSLLHHGTTVVTNMILENKGAKIGLLTTKGHERILHLARAWTPGPLYGWIGMDKPEPLADLRDTFGVEERIDATGNVVTQLNEKQCMDQVKTLIENGVESIAVALINSYLNPLHEKRIKELIKNEYPEISVSISSSIVPEYGEYERTLTTVMNTYAQPQILKYLNNLETVQKEKGFKGEFNIIRSDGGTMSVESASEKPVDIAFSGPSGGVIGSSYISELIDIPNALILDMGGTSTDVSSVINKKASIKRNVQLGYYEFISRTVDIHSVGAGGGSIAHLTDTGTLLVGPQSAGADPGPASYGNGGQDPTVTDANVVLHRLPPNVKLGGDYKIDEAEARKSIEPLAKKLNLSVEQTAQGIIDIANENMHSALRVVSVEQGYDPREFGLISFGGAGPLHANALGKLINAFPVIIPPVPGVMSSFGFLSSHTQNEFAETYLKIVEYTETDEFNQSLDLLKMEANDWLDKENVKESEKGFEYYVDCRYYRQNIQIPCKLDINLLKSEGIGLIRKIFEKEHFRRFGFTLDTDIEMATIRVIGKGDVQGIELEKSEVSAEGKPEPQDHEDVYFDNQFIRTPIYKRDELQSGHKIHGPAIIVQEDTTVVIEPNFVGEIDNYKNIIILKEES